MHPLARLGWHALLACGLCLALLTPALASAQDRNVVEDGAARGGCDTASKKRPKKAKKRASRRKAAAKNKRDAASNTRDKASKTRAASKRSKTPKAERGGRAAGPKRAAATKRSSRDARRAAQTTRTLKRAAVVPAPAPEPARDAQADAIKPRARKRSRGHLDSLDPTFRAKVERVMARLREKGWRPVVISGRRDAEQQARIVRAGRSGTMKSYHLCGRAADIADARYGWRGEAKSPSFAFWTDLGEAAQAEGLVWGGEWKRKDIPHVQSKRRCDM